MNEETLFAIYWQMYKLRYELWNTLVADDCDTWTLPEYDKPTLKRLHHQASVWILQFNFSPEFNADPRLRSDLEALKQVSDLFADAILTRALVTVGYLFCRKAKIEPQIEYGQS